MTQQSHDAHPWYAICGTRQPNLWHRELTNRKRQHPDQQSVSKIMNTKEPGSEKQGAAGLGLQESSKQQDIWRPFLRIVYSEVLDCWWLGGLVFWPHPSVFSSFLNVCLMLYYSRLHSQVCFIVQCLCLLYYSSLYVYVSCHMSLVFQFNLVCGDEWKQPLTSLVYFLGGLSGCLFSGQISDRYFSVSVQTVSCSLSSRLLQS